MNEPDIDLLRQWIGREDVAEDIVTRDLVRKLRATLSIPGSTPAGGEIAPRLIHFCLAQPALPPSALGPDGHPARGGFLPPVPLPRRMWAGGAFTFHGELRVGDTAQRRSRIADVTLKQGRTGSLCFVAVDHRVSVGDRLVVEERQDIVYRGAESAAPKPAERALPGIHVRPFDTSPTTLFRYSALTFNGHRIHYDRRYAIEREGYPGLVVHGPMQATLLLHFATELLKTPPRRFSFRSLSTLFDDDACFLHAREDEDGLSLWTVRDGGPVAMTAKAFRG